MGSSVGNLDSNKAEDHLLGVSHHHVEDFAIVHANQGIQGGILVIHVDGHGGCEDDYERSGGVEQFISK